MTSAQSKTLTGTSSSVPRLTGCQVGLRIRSKTGKNGVTQRRAVPVFAVGERTVEHVDTLHWLRPALYEGWDVEEFSSEPPEPTLSLVDDDMHNLRAFKVLASDIAGECESLGKRDGRIVRAVRHSSIRQTSNDGKALKLTFPETADATSLRESLRIVFLKGVDIYTDSLQQRGLLDTRHSDPAVIPHGYGGLCKGWEDGCPEELRHEASLRRRLSFHKQKETVELINEIGELLGVGRTTISENVGGAPGHAANLPARKALDSATMADLVSLIKRDPSARTRTWEQLRERIHAHSIQSGAQASPLPSTDRTVLATQSASEEAPLTVLRPRANGATRVTTNPPIESVALHRDAVSGPTKSHQPKGSKFLASSVSLASGRKAEPSAQSVLQPRGGSVPSSDGREDGAGKDERHGLGNYWKRNPDLLLADYYKHKDGEELANRVRSYFDMPLKFGEDARKGPWDPSLDAKSTCV